MISFGLLFRIEIEEFWGAWWCMTTLAEYSTGRRLLGMFEGKVVSRDV